MTSCGVPTLRKEDYQLFMKRLRKRVGHKKAYPLKYYAVGEYGGQTYRPHYHAIMYNLPESLSKPTYDFVSEFNEELGEIWKKGKVHVGRGETASIAYTAGYVNSKIKKAVMLLNEETGELYNDPREKEFSLMSKKLGIGFITENMKRYLTENMLGYVMVNGVAQPLPRYFKEKIFTKEERQQLNFKAAQYRKIDINDPEQIRIENEIKRHKILQFEKKVNRTINSI